MAITWRRQSISITDWEEKEQEKDRKEKKQKDTCKPAWITLKFTDDIQQITGTCMCLVGSEELNEVEAYALMNYRQKFGRHSSLREVGVARSLRKFREFFAQVDKEARFVLRMPVEDRDIFTLGQWD